MHAVLVSVGINDEQAARQALEEEVVPAVSQLPGFVAGYWLEPTDGRGYSTVVFESEEDAKRAADGVAERIPDAVTLQHVETRAVVAHA